MTSPSFPARRAGAAALAAGLAATLAACGTTGIASGPPGLDTSSPAAPRCSPVIYPGDALLRGDQGTAVVTARVSPAGEVVGTALAGSSGNRQLDDQSLLALRWCRFPAAETERTEEVMVVWELVASPMFTDRGVVRIGLRRAP